LTLTPGWKKILQVKPNLFYYHLEAYQVSKTDNTYNMKSQTKLTSDFQLNRRKKNNNKRSGNKKKFVTCSHFFLLQTGQQRKLKRVNDELFALE
jgi:hypothetical protein